MTVEELKSWFFDKFNSCYQIKHDDYDDSLFFLYDDAFLRKVKLCKINNQEVILPTKINGVCLFAISFKYNKLYCNYLEIWKYLNDNFSYNNYSVQTLINDWLNETDNLRILIPYHTSRLILNELDDTKKLSVLKPSFSYIFIPKEGLEQTDKLTIL